MRQCHYAFSPCSLPLPIASYHDEAFLLHPPLSSHPRHAFFMTSKEISWNIKVETGSNFQIQMSVCLVIRQTRFVLICHTNERRGGGNRNTAAYRKVQFASSFLNLLGKWNSRSSRRIYHVSGGGSDRRPLSKVNDRRFHIVKLPHSRAGLSGE